MSSKLFSPLKLRELTLKNRIIVSPMCMYSAVNGVPNDWHMVHLGSRAVGGAAVVIVEGTGITAEGRISNACLALYNQVQVQAFKPITAFIKSQGSIPAIQLNHSGRKGSTAPEWDNHGVLSKEESWQTVGPSPIPFSPRYQTPKELSKQDISVLLENFKHSARLALEAGFEIIEAHAAHGYLLHQFLSPLSNQRSDEYGGALENRMRFPLMVAKGLRDVWPAHLPVFFRLSATDWTEGGWTLEESIVFCRELKKIGIDFIDVSTGGNVSSAKIPVEPGYQVPFAKEIKRQADIITGAVGLITNAQQAEEILNAEEADAILLAREFLREPYWPIKAALELGETIHVPRQYERGYK
jgi:2,4-dienoyl-CoA reductase-like NADH-dependent reductase (Old Yellow Enzyme family)